MPGRRQADELIGINIAQIDIADVGAERGYDMLDNDDPDCLWIERASERRRQLLEPSRSLFAAVALGDVAIRLHHVAATRVDDDLMPRLDNQPPLVFAGVCRFDLGDTVLREPLHQPRQTPRHAL